MAAREIRPGVYHVGAIDWDRRLFDEFIPLPDGTSYNAYLIKGSTKTALIDTVDPTKEAELLKNLKKLEIDRLDYIVSNHSEQDHSGCIPRILEEYPNAKVVTNAKGAKMLQELLLIDEQKFIVIKDEETLSLGDKTLEFMSAPWVHWPETIFTYLRELKILFSCDFLGSHLATSSLYVNDPGKMSIAAKRYYAEIMMPFRAHINKHLEKLADLDVEIVAPSHGPLYDAPDSIIDMYKDWAGDDVSNEVVVVYVSMHGSTRTLVDYFVDSLITKGVEVKPFNLSRTDIGELAIALVDTATLVVASPMVLAGLHPTVAHAAIIANALRPKLKFMSMLGSFGWGGKMVDQLSGLTTNLKAEMLEPVIVKGSPGKEGFDQVDRLVSDIVERHRDL